MNEYVFLPPNVIEEMKHLMPPEFAKDYFTAYREMTEQYILKNKERHKVIKAKILGKKGISDVIVGTLMDAIEVRNDFVKVFKEK